MNTEKPSIDDIFDKWMVSVLDGDFGSVRSIRQAQRRAAFVALFTLIYEQGYSKFDISNYNKERAVVLFYSEKSKTSKQWRKDVLADWDIELLKVFAATIDLESHKVRDLKADKEKAKIEWEAARTSFGEEEDEVEFFSIGKPVEPSFLERLRRSAPKTKYCKATCERLGIPYPGEGEGE